ncbi:MAG: triose-phosphate isomerase [Candidatus Peribacteria bacterium]|nr:MAG: triose-phosphate isomerase [Candidatus Peribacteria bacterium]
MKYLIGANFKMNKTTSELKEYLKVFKEKYACFINIDLMIAPVSAGLGVASENLEGSCINLGAQNMYFEESGAYTGEISPTMLRDLNCQYVILGHSERRQFFHESDELINKKVSAALTHGIRPILCIGENLEQKNKGLTKEVLKIQLVEGLWGIEDTSLVDIAYEPVWAIGTGEVATPEYVAEIHQYIREILNPHPNPLLRSNFEDSRASTPVSVIPSQGEGTSKSRIIYGGSVKPENAPELIKIENVDGFLIGGAALKPEGLLGIVEGVLD